MFAKYIYINKIGKIYQGKTSCYPILKNDIIINKFGNEKRNEYEYEKTIIFFIC